MTDDPLHRPTQIFLSYAHGDTDRLDQFLTHFGPVKRAKGLALWDDRNLRAGELWDDGIRQAIKDSDIFICLVTNAFLNSNYIRDTELPAIKQAKNRGALIVPIILEKSFWQDEFGEIQSVPKTQRGALRPIVNWKPRNDGYHEAAAQAADAIQSYLDKQPPAPEGPGPSLIVTPDGMEIADDAPTPAERRDPLQQQLLDLLRNRLAGFEEPLKLSCGNTHRILCDEFDLYRAFVPDTLEDLNIGALVGIGNALSGMIKRLTPPLPEGVMTEPLEPEILGGLEAILSDHARLVMGFAEGRELIQRTAVFRAEIDAPAERAAETKPVLTAMREESGLLAPNAQKLVASVENGIAIANVKGLESLAEAIHIGGRFVGDVAQKIGRISQQASGPLTIAAFGSIMAGDPNFETYRAALQFLNGNASQIAAFAASQDEFRRILNWTMEQIGVRARGTVEWSDDVAATSETLGEPPADFDLDEVHQMIRRGEAPPERWMPWITELRFLGIKDGHSIRDLSPLLGLKNLRALDCWGTNISDLTPIANLPMLRVIDCSLTEVADLSPIADLQSLEALECSHTQVADLTSLANLRSLQTLDCAYTQVDDLTPVANLQSLRTLDCANTQVADLITIANLQNLQTLDCAATEVADLTPVANLQSLQRLDCASTQVADLTPVANLQSLQTLDCDNTQVADLTPVANLQSLQRLDCASTQVADLTPVANLQSLQRLDCASTEVADLTPVANLQSLQRLDCTRTPVADLSPVANLQSLQTLVCAGTEVADLTPVANLQSLQRLDCTGTPVADLTPVANLQSLQALDCARTPVADLTPVANLQNLQTLDCASTQVADLTPVANLQSLQRLDCSHTQVNDIALIGNLQNLQTLDCSATQLADLICPRNLISLSVAHCGRLDLDFKLPPSVQELDLFGLEWTTGRPLPDVRYRIDPDGAVHDPDGGASGHFDGWARRAEPRN